MDKALYGEHLYDEVLYSGSGATGYWYNSFQFTYLKGASVYITLTATQTVGPCQTIKYECGESLATLLPVTPGTKTPLLFQSAASGPANVYIKATLTSNQYGISPSISRIQATIEQKTSLYTVAETVLIDALQDSGVGYFIDPFLQNISIPYSWFDPVTHREAIGKIAEACGGRAYQSRDGGIRLESILYSGNGNGIADTINQDRILDSKTPVSDVKNRIKITTNPMVKQTATQVYQSSETVNSGESKTINVFFNDYDAVMNASASIASTPTGATITSQTWYTWGGDLTILGSAANQACTITVTGDPLVVSGSKVVTRDNSESIRQNGLRVLHIQDNQLIQDAEIAGLIADSLLDVASVPRRDIEADWRGDPTIELDDKIVLDGQHGVVVENNITFNGALSAQIKMERTSG